MNAGFVRAHADGQREHSRGTTYLARDRARPVAGDGAHPLPRRGQLERRIQGWEKGYNVRTGEGKIDRAAIEDGRIKPGQLLDFKVDEPPPKRKQAEPRAKRRTQGVAARVV